MILKFIKNLTSRNAFRYLIVIKNIILCLCNSNDYNLKIKKIIDLVVIFLIGIPHLVDIFEVLWM